MLKSPLPNTIEPLKLVAKRTCMKGCIELGLLQRLRPELVGESEKNLVDVELVFAKSPDGLATASGFARADMFLVCQRCLNPMAFRVDAVINWVFVSDETLMSQVPASSEAILLNEETISLFDLIEDELLLSLPVIPMHQEGECKEQGYSLVSTNESQHKDDVPVKKSPFVVLADFKKKS